MATAQPTSIRVTPLDIVEQRAFVRFSPEAKIALCHLAGAPWFDKDESATLHDLQREVLSRPEREKIVHGASRLGKSVLGGCEGLIETMLPHAKCAIVAARYDHVAHEFQYIHRGLRKLFDGVPQAFVRLVFRNTQNYHEHDAHTIWGSRTRGYSTDSDDGASLLGQMFTRVILGEGSHISPEILDKKVMRAIDGALMARQDGRQHDTGFLSIYTTPKGYEGCSAAEWERVLKQTNRNPEMLHYANTSFAESVWIREANILENPAYSRSVFAARKKSLDKVAFEEQYLGKMTFKTGRIYKEYDEERHTFLTGVYSPTDIRKMRLGIGMDTGAYFGAILVGTDQDHRHHVLGEVYSQQQTITVAMDELKDMVIRVVGPAFGVKDFTKLKDRIDLWNVDPASQHKLEIMEALDIGIAHPVYAGTEGKKFGLLPTIDIVRELFKNNRLDIDEDCTYLNDMLRKYVWKHVKTIGATAASRMPVITEPKKAYDHLCDALRFIVVTMDMLGPLDELPVPETIQEAWNQSIRDRLHGPLREAKRRGEEMWRSNQQ